MCTGESRNAISDRVARSRLVGPDDGSHTFKLSIEDSNMSTKKTAKKASAQITSVKKGEIYENQHNDLIEVANGRLKDEGELGSSFEGRTITFNAETKNANRGKSAERFYLDELARKLTKAEYDEWVEAGRREAEASEPDTAPTSKTKKKVATNKSKAKSTTKERGKMSALDAAAKVHAESGEPMTTKAMIETMATKGYWTSPVGKTPAATLYAAILREIGTKDKAARFVKTDRGQFAINPKAAS